MLELQCLADWGMSSLAPLEPKAVLRLDDRDHHDRTAKVQGDGWKLNISPGPIE